MYPSHTRAKKSYSYRYLMKYMQLDETRHLYGRDLFWGDNMLAPNTDDYQRIDNLVPDLSNRVSEGVVYFISLIYARNMQDSGMDFLLENSREPSQKERIRVPL